MIYYYDYIVTLSYAPRGSFTAVGFPRRNLISASAIHSPPLASKEKTAVVGIILCQANSQSLGRASVRFVTEPRASVRVVTGPVERAKSVSK